MSLLIRIVSRQKDPEESLIKRFHPALAVCR